MTWGAEIAEAQAGIREGYRGHTAALIKPGATTGPAHNPTRGASTEQTCYIGEAAISLRERDGTLIQTQDRRFIISPEGLTSGPATGDSLRVGADTLSIVTVDPVAPGGAVIYWKVIARGT